MNSELIKLLEDVKQYIEESEVAMEQTVGQCRNLEKLIVAGAMPELYSLVLGHLAALRSQEEVPSSLIATEYYDRREFENCCIGMTCFARMRSPFYEGERWAVRRGCSCLSVEGRWIVEPSPSSRDDTFYALCRFPTLAAAKAALEAHR